ncbi:unnamed protein product [Lactuca saligna]|uniref:Homeobox-leucine zipper protein n=1 Tax=Lactuca saligna TaxID=75948 RepID=A0AA35YA09_LACSI|nr:unnamed protein product [Lactuca saligna]
MLHTSHEDDHNAPSLLSPFLQPCTTSQDFHGLASFFGKRSMSYATELCDQETKNGEEELSDDVLLGAARELGLQPRQIAIRFRNRRARWKTKQLEKDYDVLKNQFEAIKTQNDSLLSQNYKLHAEVLALKNKNSTELINLNVKEKEGSCSNRSENSSEIKLDILRTPATDSPSFHTTTTIIIQSLISFHPPL